MGLTKVTVEAIGKDYNLRKREIIRCDEMSNDILFVKKKKTIEKGSLIYVNHKQCVAIYKNEEIIDATMEEGVYIFEESESTAFKSDIFLENSKKAWNEYKYNEDEDFIVFFNLKNIKDNKFLLTKEILFTDNTNRLFLIKKCIINYDIKLVNPAILLNETSESLKVCRKGRLNEFLKLPLEETMKIIFLELEKLIDALKDVEGHPEVIKKIDKGKIIDESIQKKGFSLVGVNIENIQFSRKYRKKTDKEINALPSNQDNNKSVNSENSNNKDIQTTKDENIKNEVKIVNETKDKDIDAKEKAEKSIRFDDNYAKVIETEIDSISDSIVNQKNESNMDLNNSMTVEEDMKNVENEIYYNNDFEDKIQEQSDLKNDETKAKDINDEFDNEEIEETSEKIQEKQYAEKEINIFEDKKVEKGKVLESNINDEWDKDINNSVETYSIAAQLESLFADDL